MSLASVSNIKQTLISIHDITGIEFGHTFPRHGLVLLHWLANNIHNDNNGNMRLKFNPSRGDYGFNFYGNADRPRPLPFLPSESGSYYSLGNIDGNYNYNGATALPDYVTQSFYNSWIPERNRDRVIIRVREEGSNQFIVDEVYITQHYPPNENRGSVYDPDNTYPVSFSLKINDNSVENIWTHTPGLALLLAIAFGYKPNASLQLFVKDGKACARLYVKKSFTDWKEKFNNSWVGFYSSEKNNTNEYNTYQWQWAVKFSEESRSDWKDIPEYDVYVYRSSMPMSPGVQARFMLEKFGGEKARTPPWEVHTSAI
ncbi:uncharacterized protein [Oncorhynchus clarkii lewisi]|uniref:uncharacterized protein n=1 Tax=Oncorhynchus clarkii lewisi TaxID=490388 RepID=UPI0039B89DCF